IKAIAARGDCHILIAMVAWPAVQPGWRAALPYCERRINAARHHFAIREHGEAVNTMHLGMNTGVKTRGGLALQKDSAIRPEPPPSHRWDAHVSPLSNKQRSPIGVPGERADIAAGRHPAPILSVPIPPTPLGTIGWFTGSFDRHGNALGA